MDKAFLDYWKQRLSQRPKEIATGKTVYDEAEALMGLAIFKRVMQLEIKESNDL